MMMMMIVYLLYLIVLTLPKAFAFNVLLNGKCGSRQSLQHSSLFMENNDDDIDDMPIIAQSTVKIDDGGSDLTNRFKYKVNALMGNYDPVQAETDNETTDGNILEALMNFPTMYAFNIVGRTSGDDEVTKKYIDDVNEVVLEISGDKELQFNTVPRGKSFTKITVEASVESSSMITLIYEKLAELELTVMRF